jgi:hypothetical protein
MIDVSIPPRAMALDNTWKKLVVDIKNLVGWPRTIGDKKWRNRLWHIDRRFVIRDFGICNKDGPKRRLSERNRNVILADPNEVQIERKKKNKVGSNIFRVSRMKWSIHDVLTDRALCSQIGWRLQKIWWGFKTWTYSQFWEKSTGSDWKRRECNGLTSKSFLNGCLPIPQRHCPRQRRYSKQCDTNNHHTIALIHICPELIFSRFRVWASRKEPQNQPTVKGAEFERSVFSLPEWQTNLWLTYNVDRI